MSNSNISKKKYETFDGLSLYIKHENKKSSSLNFGLVDKRPRFTCFLKDKDKIDFINIKFTYVALAGFFGLLEKLIASDDLEESFEMVSLDTVFVDNQRTDDTGPIGKIVLHRNKQGAIYLSVSKEGTKTYDFPLSLEGRYHTTTRKGIPITSSKGMSDAIASKFSELVQHAYGEAIYENRYSVVR